MKEVEIVIAGKVQGVGYRAFISGAAQKCNIRGCVSNELSGAVEITAQGSEADLAAFIELIKDGPYWARVDRFDIKWHQPSDVLMDFQIIEPTL